MGVPAGVFAFLMMRIAWEHVTQVLPPGPAAWVATLIFGAMGLSGAAVLPSVGLSMFDVVIAAPLALAYLLVLRAVILRSTGSERSPWLLPIAGVELPPSNRTCGVGC